MQDRPNFSRNGAHAALPGVKLWFIDTGGTGTPVVLLHPNTGTVETWDSQIAAFSQAGYRVIAFDRRGWGKSVADPAASSQAASVTADLHALVEHLKLDAFHLLGVAGGGFAALDYAAWQPQRLRSLIVGGTTGAIQDKEVPISWRALPFPTSGNSRRITRDRAVISRRQSGRRQTLDRDRRTFAPARRRLPAGAAHPEHAGEDRGHFNPDAGDRRGRRSPGAAGLDANLGRAFAASSMAEIHDAGHAMAWEQPGRFNDIVLDFLRRH